jgi:regulatory protein
MSARAVDKTSAEQAFRAALRLLERHAYSERKLRDKLRDKGFTQAAVQEALTVCHQRKLVSDRDFARLFIEQRLERRPRAGHVLVRELLQRGIPLRLAKEVVEECVTTEIEAASAKALAVRKWKQYAHLDPTICFRRVSSLLARRGFTWEMINEAIAEAQTAFQENRQE